MGLFMNVYMKKVTVFRSNGGVWMMHTYNGFGTGRFLRHVFFSICLFFNMSFFLCLRVSSSCDLDRMDGQIGRLAGIAHLYRQSGV